MPRNTVYDPAVAFDRYVDWQMKPIRELKCRDCLNSRLPSQDGFSEYDEICYCAFLNQFVEGDDPAFDCEGLE